MNFQKNIKPFYSFADNITESPIAIGFAAPLISRNLSGDRNVRGVSLFMGAISHMKNGIIN